MDSTQMCGLGKPARYTPWVVRAPSPKISPVTPPTLELFEKLPQGRVEALGGFEVREVAGAGEGHVVGVGDLLRHGPHDLGRGDPILLATDDQGGNLYLLQERGRVRARSEEHTS